MGAGGLPISSGGGGGGEGVEGGDRRSGYAMTGMFQNDEIILFTHAEANVLFTFSLPYVRLGRVDTAHRAEHRVFALPAVQSLEKKMKIAAFETNSG